MLKKIILFIPMVLFFQTTACSLEVKKAVAPTNPPSVEKSNFTPSLIIGEYQQSSSPTMFLWPTQKTDDSGNVVELSFNEKALARQSIGTYVEEIKFYSKKAAEADHKITAKFKKMQFGLEKEFKANKCYALCDPTNPFLCDPTNEDALTVVNWKTSVDPIEIALIDSCKKNQAEREDIITLEAEEKDKVVAPINEKTTEAFQAYMQEVGDGLFPKLTKFEFNFGKVLCLASEEKCVSSKEVNFYIALKYGKNIISNLEKNESKFQVTEVDFDKANGFLSFKIPAIDLENNNKVSGEISFDLEFVFAGEQLKVDGDIFLFDFKTQTEKTGRFSSNGKIVPFQESE